MTLNIGILDPDGENINPLTNKQYSEEYKKWGKIWRTYPTYKIAKEIIKDIIDNQVLLIIAETGAGKTVLIPKFTLHALNYKGRIAITLPKQIITKSAAEFSAKTLDVKLGDEVGYQYKGSPKNTKSDKTKLLYATDGTIVARLIKDPLLHDFDCVIIDEAHERKVQIDFLLYLLKEVIKKRKEFKIIIMSATINEDIFKTYFNEFKFKNIFLSGERKYPIESYFFERQLKYDETLIEGFKILIDILSNDDPTISGAHDIIFFVVSKNDAFKICDKLNDYAKNEIGGICKITCKGATFCVELFSGVDEDKKTLAQDKDKYKLNSFVRKVVIATEVAESSLTIDGIKFVIDTGYVLGGSYDPKFRARRLEREFITQASAKQRMGRSGRTEPGITYHMYTKIDFENKMQKFPEPDIRISDISSECLKLLSYDNIKSIPILISTLTNFIEPPKEIFIQCAVETLQNLKIIENNVIAPIGHLLLELPMNNLMLGLTFIYSKIFNCSKEILKIISIIETCKVNISELFITPKNFNDDTKLHKLKNKFIHKYGDHLSLLNIYEQYEKNNFNDNWAKSNMLKWYIMKKIKENYKMTLRRVKGINTRDLKFVNDKIIKLKLQDRIICCFVLGHQGNYGNKIFSNYVTSFAKDLNIKLGKSSFLNLKNKKPKNVIFEELFISSSLNKMEINIVSQIPKNVRKIIKINI